MALFSNQNAPGGADPNAGSPHLLSFRAGKMSMRNKTVIPDNRKGQMYISRGADMLMHLCWKDRTSGAVEDDLILFPDDAEFVPVRQCTSGRVFLLRFNNSSRKLFFWMQEPKSDKDEETCKKVNELLNNPPAENAPAAGGGGGAMSQQEILSQLGLGQGGGELGDMGLDQASMVQLLQQMVGSGGIDASALLGGLGGGGGGGGTAAAPTQAPSQPVTTPPAAAAVSTPPPATNVIQLNDLQSILANMNTPGAGGQASGGAAQASAGPGIDLESVLAAPGARDTAAAHAAELEPHLPVTGRPPNEELGESLRSAQFRQAAGLFGAALQSAQLGPVLGQFGLPPAAVAAAAHGVTANNTSRHPKNLEQVGAALQGGDDATQASPPVEGDKKKEEAADEEDKMDLD